MTLSETTLRVERACYKVRSDIKAYGDSNKYRKKTTGHNRFQTYRPNPPDEILEKYIGAASETHGVSPNYIRKILKLER